MKSITTKTAHICILSDRILPNIIPVLIEKPDTVFLMTTITMRKKGILKIMKELLIKNNCNPITVDNLPDSNICQLKSSLEYWWNKYENEYTDTKLTLNITGGNKLMTIAFIQQLQNRVDRIIYTDTFNNQLEIIESKTEKPNKIPLNGVLNIDTYLTAQGMREIKIPSNNNKWQEKAINRSAVTEFFVENINNKNFDNFIGQLNYISNEAVNSRGKIIKPIQYLNNKPKSDWLKAIQLLNKNKIIKWDNSTQIEFIDEDNTRFTGGIWLEEYAWYQAKTLNPDDVGLGVSGKWDNTQVTRNELDVIVVHKNRLLLIECKTLNMMRNTKEQGGLKHQDIIYKLDSVGDDVKGLFGQVILMSAREVPEHAVDRARHNNIIIIGPERLANFQNDLKVWMDKGKFPEKS